MATKIPKLRADEETQGAAPGFLPRLNAVAADIEKLLDRLLGPQVAEAETARPAR